MSTGGSGVVVGWGDGSGCTPSPTARDGFEDRLRERRSPSSLPLLRLRRGAGGNPSSGGERGGPLGTGGNPGPLGAGGNPGPPSRAAGVPGVSPVAAALSCGGELSQELVAELARGLGDRARPGLSPVSERSAPWSSPPALVITRCAPWSPRSEASCSRLMGLGTRGVSPARLRLPFLLKPGIGLGLGFPGKPKGKG